jgi:hypothetical protein
VGSDATEERDLTTAKPYRPQSSGAERPNRYREVIGPLGLMYEARSVSTMGGELWGAIDLAREHGRPDNSEPPSCLPFPRP